MECLNCHRVTPDDAAVCIHCHIPWKVTCKRCGGANAASQGICRLCGASLNGAAGGVVPVDSQQVAPPKPSTAGGLTPFTGRGPELSALLRALDQAASGSGQWAIVTGEAGIGKSRLRLELCQGLDPRSVLVLEGRCQANSAITPYLPFVHAFRRSFGMDVLKPTGEYVGKVVDGVLTLDPALAPHLPLILHLLSLSSSDHGLPAGLTGESYRLAMEAALQACVAAYARRRPTVLVLEDWHWADEPSRSALRALISGIAGQRVMVLVISRRDEGFDTEGGPPRIHLALPALRETETRLLIQAVLGTSRLPEGFAELLHDRATGNPFFVEEMCIALREEGTLRVDGANVSLTRPLESIALPRTVQTLLKARVDRLDGAARDVLTLAAVMGREFDLGILGALAGADIVAESLAHLEAQEMVYPVLGAAEPAYRFKHVLTQIAVYESLAPDHRRELHGRVLRAMEHAYRDRIEAQVEALAYHAVQGEQWEQALRYNRLAGLKALARFAFREAGAALELALAAHRKLPDSPAHTRLGVELLLLLHPAYIPQGRFGDLLQHMATAEAGALALDDAALLAQISAQRGYYHFLLGDFRKALQPTAAGTEFAKRCGELQARVTANYYAGITRYAAGDFHGAIRVLQDTIQAIPEEQWFNRFGSAGLPASIARVLGGICMAELGVFPEGLSLAREGVAITERSEVVLNTAIAYWLLAMCHARQGDFAAAARVSEQGLKLCEQRPVRMAFSQLAGVAGEAYLRSGRAEDAVALLEQAVQPEQFNRGFKFVSPMVTLAEAYLELGFLPEAHKLGVEALARCRASGDRRSEVWALRLAGLLALRGHAPHGEDAEYWFGEALALASQLQMRPMMAHCRVGRGQALLGRKQRAEGEREIRTAIREYDAMGMAYWAYRADGLFAAD